MTQQRVGTLALALVAPGQRVRVVDIAAGQRVTHRLTELGIIRGAELEVLQSGWGPLLIAVGDTRLALERGIAHTIRVQPT